MTEAMENDNAPHKWTREGLIEVRDTYRAKLNRVSPTKIVANPIALPV